MGPSGRFTHVMIYLTVWDRFIQELYLGRAPRTKETLPDFLKWRRVTRHPLVFRGLTGSQRTPGFWDITIGELTQKANLIGGRTFLAKLPLHNFMWNRCVIVSMPTLEKWDIRRRLTL